MDEQGSLSVRIDKWLWAARLFKTRTLAQEAIELGRVKVGGERVKASRGLKEGAFVTVKRGDDTMEVIVTGLSEKRGSASDAAKLYEETESSRNLRRARKDILKLAADPAASIRGGRPTKREGRRLRAFRRGGDY
ncbi:MAG: RNA-binding S4 domain-containing protein [Sutterellaceae bacterium]|nr:RNA-binding S4 domain-containing protein [Sutterellaceae bacterium]MDD7442406.1 RNA-binding S4 domain-containing protein [Sutterellaceae bacterium]MDY2867176.1 RNA-binding S4 domain-containing protein [Mesosutterella sp.]